MSLLKLENDFRWEHVVGNTTEPMDLRRTERKMIKTWAISRGHSLPSLHHVVSWPHGLCRPLLPPACDGGTVGGTVPPKHLPCPLHDNHFCVEFPACEAGGKLVGLGEFSLSVGSRWPDGPSRHVHNHTPYLRGHEMAPRGSLPSPHSPCEGNPWIGQPAVGLATLQDWLIPRRVPRRVTCREERQDYHANAISPTPNAQGMKK